MQLFSHGATGRGAASTVVSIAVIVGDYDSTAQAVAALRQAAQQDLENKEIVVALHGGGPSRDALLQAAAGEPNATVLDGLSAGPAQALNTAVRATSGSYLSWVHAGDKLRPDAMGRLLRRAEAEGACGAILFGDEEASPEKLGTTRGSVSALLTSGRAGAALVPREIVLEMPFDERLGTAYEQDLFLRAAMRGRAIRHVPQSVLDRAAPRTVAPDELRTVWAEALRQSAQALNVDVSVHRFYIDVASNLQACGAAEAAARAKALGQEAARTDRSKMLVSVVIPFHSGAELLRAAVHSVLAQTHRNLEILIVYDQGEPDPRNAVRFHETDGIRIHLLQQPSRGAGKARNYGMLRAKGDFVAFLDADDYWLPTKVDAQLRLMLEDGAAISHCSYFLHGADCRMPSGFQNSGIVSGRVFPDIIGNNPVAMPTVMVRSDVAKRFAFPDAPGCEDFLWLLSIVREEELLGTSEPLCVVRITPDSVAYHPQKQATSLRKIIAALESDRSFAPYQAQIDRLKGLLPALDAQSGAA